MSAVGARGQGSFSDSATVTASSLQTLSSILFLWNAGTALVEILRCPWLTNRNSQMPMTDQLFQINFAEWFTRACWCYCNNRLKHHHLDGSFFECCKLHCCPWWLVDCALLLIWNINILILDASVYCNARYFCCSDDCAWAVLGLYLYLLLRYLGWQVVFGCSVAALAGVGMIIMRCLPHMHFETRF